MAVAIGEDGRILAQGKGRTEIVVTYAGFERTINVTVLETVNLLTEEKLHYESFKQSAQYKDFAPQSISTSDREAIREKALAMISYVWHPTKDLIGWKSQYTLKKGDGVLGIPYTQGNQVNDTGFANALSKSDFYTPLEFVQNNLKYKEPMR